MLIVWWCTKISMLNAPGYSDDLKWKKKKKTVKGDWCEPAKDLPTVKLVFSIEHKNCELMNSRTYLNWMRLDPFIEG